MSRRSAFILFIPVLAIGLVLDRLSKAWAAKALSGVGDGPDLGPVRLTLVHNKGAAFGMGAGHQEIFVVFAIVVIAAIVIWLAASKRHSRVGVFALALVAAGAVGNCIDRVAQGFVTDFIEFTFIEFPVFNVADICVTCGVVLFVVSVLFLLPDSDAEEGRR